jgi:hypothetical protein
MESYLAVPLGFLAGVLLWSIAARWVLVIANTIREYRSNVSSERRKMPLVRALALVGFLHSGPWALGIVGYVSYYVLAHPHAWWWAWFFGGAALAPLVMAVVVARIMFTRKRREAEGNNVTDAA